MSRQTNILPDNPQIEVIKSGKTGLFTNYIFKAIPLAFDESMSYYETLCGLLYYLKNTIIPTVNNNADAVAELQGLYEQLRSYVDNYFTNLDVQEEINNKLDQMVADGTLPEIVASYLETKAIFGFDNVESMKNATNLINGSYAKTLGYYSKNDGGNALYKIRTINNDVVDNATIILLNNNNLIAELIINEDTINPIKFGCYGDGNHDDTINLQKCINYAIANKKQIDIIGNYKVNPIEMEDNTKVCLTVYRDASDGSNGTDTGITFNFIRESSIYTESQDECTLMRFNINNINFENALLKGVQGKTTLIELSKIDKMSATEVQWSCYNIFRNCMLLSSKQAIHMEGNTYYNTFDKVTIRYCTDGIVLDYTLREKLGLSQNSNVNRNDFSNITIQQSTGKAIAIYYGDTNKFINISFEGINDGIYLDDPQQHLNDFTIKPKWNSAMNMFMNIVSEIETGIPIYNNSDGVNFINISIPYQHPKNVWLKQPHLYMAGLNNIHSLENIMDILKTREELQIPNTQKYSTIVDSLNGMVSRNYSDMEVTNGNYKVLSRKNITFDETNITNLKPDTHLSYETTYKCITKQIGGIVYMTTKFTMQPNDLNSNIEIPIPSDMQPDSRIYNYLNLPAMVVPICVYVNNQPTLVSCSIQSTKIRIYPPSNGWSSSIQVCLNINWFRNELNL